MGGGVEECTWMRVVGGFGNFGMVAVVGDFVLLLMLRGEG